MVENIETSGQKNLELPYRFSGDYTPAEYAILENFMHADFPNITFKNRKGGSVVIEYPPSEIINAENWKAALDVILVPELALFHQSVLRRKTIVRFVDELKDKNNNFSAGGNGHMSEFNLGEDWIRIVYKYDDGQKIYDSVCLFRLMHELIEGDFWEKTLSGDVESNIVKEVEMNLFSNSTGDYANLLDEKITNRRAIRAVRRLWPFFHFINGPYNYEEDK